MGFSRQEYWSGLPCPPSGDLSNLGMNPGLPHCRRTFLNCLSHQGNPRIQEWVAYPRASLVAQMVKNPPAWRETWLPSLGWEDPLKKGVATHSSILAWRIPMDRGAWRAAVHVVARSWTQLSNSASTAQSIPSPGDLPKPGIEPGSHELQADSLPAELLGKPKWKLA